MKKVFAAGLVCMMVLVPAVAAYATEVPETYRIGECKPEECFLDTDCDGICGDHCFVDENGDGICDNHCYLDEDADGFCDFFVDENADGICDHCHDHGKPVQSDANAESTTNNDTYNNNRSHHSNSNHSNSNRNGRHCCGHC